MAGCPVCGGSSQKGAPFDGRMRTPISCPGCGDFVITQSAERVLKDEPSKVAIVSRWFRRLCDMGEKPEVDRSRLLKIISENSRVSVAEQADRIILLLGDKLLGLGRPDQRITLLDHRRIAATVGAAPEPGGAVMYLVSESAARGLISPNISQYSDHLDSLSRVGNITRH
jgi:hypothetical protein